MQTKAVQGSEARARVIECFERNAGNVRATARELGLHRATVQEHLRNAGAGKRPLVGGKIVGTKKVKESLPRRNTIKRYILTSAQNNTHVHAAFWQNVQALAEHYGAKILVGTFSYNQNH